jgi:hypothetical protein
MPAKKVVELTDARVARMMQSSIFTAEFPFLRELLTAGRSRKEAVLPANCTPCQRKRLMKQAAAGRQVNYEDARRRIRSLPHDKLKRLKLLLQATEVRVPYLEDGKRVVLKF